MASWRFGKAGEYAKVSEDLRFKGRFAGRPKNATLTIQGKTRLPRVPLFPQRAGQVPVPSVGTIWTFCCPSPRRITTGSGSPIVHSPSKW